MKALYIEDAKKVSFKTDAPMPECGPGEALIKIKYAGICGSDLHLYHNGISHFGGNPYILGHEFVGTVIASNHTGEVGYQIGDMVTALTYHSCGKCPQCKEGRTSICKSLRNCGFGLDGTYAEYLKVKCDKIYPFRKELDPKICAMAEPLAVAVFDVGKSGFKAGNSVFISGGGPIGAIIAVYARHCGASNVVVSEINENRLRFIESLGIATLNPMVENPVAAALEKNDGKPFDVAFEVAGAQSSYDLIFDVVKRGGFVVPVAPPAKRREIDLNKFLHDQICMVGVNLYDEPYFEEAVRLVNSGVINDMLEKFITDIYPIEDAEKAYLAAMNPQGTHVKILIDCET